jgi:hypothetical protein
MLPLAEAPRSDPMSLVDGVEFITVDKRASLAGLTTGSMSC